MDTTTSFSKPLLLCGVFVLTACSEQVSIDNSGPIAGWTHYGGGPGGGHFSPATQITPGKRSRAGSRLGVSLRRL